MLKGTPRGQGRPGRLHRPLVRASADMGMLVAALAEEGVKPGSVDAPIGVIIGAAVVVTAVLTFAIPAALKPGAWPPELNKVDVCPTSAHWCTLVKLVADQQCRCRNRCCRADL